MGCSSTSSSWALYSMIKNPGTADTAATQAQTQSVGTDLLTLLGKLQKGLTLTERENRDLHNLPSTLMICYLNGFEDAKQKLIDAKPLLKPFPNIYLSFKEALRILRKMKYDLQ